MTALSRGSFSIVLTPTGLAVAILNEGAIVSGPLAEDKKMIICQSLHCTNLNLVRNLWHQHFTQFAALNSLIKQKSPSRIKIEAESGSGDAAVAAAREDTE